MPDKLTAAFVRTVTEPGKYGGGRSLMLLVHPSGRKQFVHRITIKGKRRDLGVGAYPEVSLAEARDRARRRVRFVRRDPGGRTILPFARPTGSRSRLPRGFGARVPLDQSATVTARHLNTS